MNGGNGGNRKCDFLHFAGEILQKKILILRITHSHRPSLNFSSDFIFSQGWSFSSLGGLSPPLPPLVYATVGQHMQLRVYCNDFYYTSQTHIKTPILKVIGNFVNHNNILKLFIYVTNIESNLL